MTAQNEQKQRFAPRIALFHQEAGTLEWLTVLEHNHLVQEAEAKAYDEAFEKISYALLNDAPDWDELNLIAKSFQGKAEKIRGGK